MGHWEDEYCKYCGGHIAEKSVDLYRKVEGKPVLIENIPAGVCIACGARFYTADVLKALEEMIRGRHTTQREVLIPVYSLLPLHQVILEKQLQDQESKIEVTQERSTT